MFWSVITGDENELLTSGIQNTYLLVWAGQELAKFGQKGHLKGKKGKIDQNGTKSMVATHLWVH